MRSIIAIVFLYVVLLVPASASAQFGAVPFRDPATGESYHIEAAGEIWNPTPQLVFSSEALGIAGNDIDAVSELGIAKNVFKELRLTLRPARKHKLRLQYLPVQYLAQATVVREFRFNGLRFPIGLPVTTTFAWKTWLVAYEYDFTYHDRWFAGLILDAKLTDVNVQLDSPIKCISGGVAGPCFAHAKAPIPTLGGIVRVYVVPNISVTGEMTGIKIPNSVSPDYRAHYFDFDMYGTVNFNDYVGAQIGYRRIDIGYVVKKDSGTFLEKGLYFGGVIRY